MNAWPPDIIHLRIPDAEKELISQASLSLAGKVDPEAVDASIRNMLTGIAINRDRFNRTHWLLTTANPFADNFLGRQIGSSLRAITTSQLFGFVRLLTQLETCLVHCIAVLRQTHRKIEAVRLVKLLLECGVGVDFVQKVAGLIPADCDLQGLILHKRKCISTLKRMPFSLLWRKESNTYLLGHAGIYEYDADWQPLGPRLDHLKFELGPYLLAGEEHIYVAAGGGACTIHRFNHDLNKETARLSLKKPAGKVWLMPDNNILVSLLDNNQGPHALILSPDLTVLNNIRFPKGPTRLPGDIFHLAPLGTVPEDDRIAVFSSNSPYTQAIYVYTPAKDAYIDRYPIPIKDIQLVTAAVHDDTLIAAGDSIVASLHLPSRTWHTEIIPEYSADLISLSQEKDGLFVYFLGSWYSNMLRWHLSPVQHLTDTTGD
ncbi:MAG: hypothetical protein HQK65_17915 [Desulfamplus sp.]|nr:hypothetical protein [Desulfamplus sp.]